MKWRAYVILPALIILITHSLIAHEHDAGGRLFAKWDDNASCETSLLSCFIATNTGHDHFEHFQEGQQVAGVSFRKRTEAPSAITELILLPYHPRLFLATIFTRGPDLGRPAPGALCQISRRGPPSIVISSLG